MPKPPARQTDPALRSVQCWFCLLRGCRPRVSEAAWPQLKALPQIRPVSKFPPASRDTNSITFMQKKTLQNGFIAFALTIGATTTQGEDWTQYRGPNFDGSSSEQLNIPAWPSGGVKAVWKEPTRLGFASFAVAKRRAFTIVMEEVDGVDREVCLALDGDTGKNSGAKF